MGKQAAFDELEELFRQFYRRMAADWNRLVETELSASQAMILELLLAQGPQKPTELAQRLDITVSAVTSLADKLERAGLLRRERSEVDRRVVMLSATARAGGVLQRVKAQRHALFKRYFQDLSHEDLRHLIRIYRGILSR